MAFIVDPLFFEARGAFMFWNVEARRRGIPGFENLPPNIQLRWMLNASLGLPTEPFKVWTRPHTREAFTQPLTLLPRNLFLGAVTVYTWTEGSASSVQLTVNSSTAGNAIGFTAAPTPANFCASGFFPAGGGQVELTASAIDGVVLPSGATVTAARGVLPSTYANATGWTLLEIVGLPVGGVWSGIGQHAREQGLIAALTNPPSAAIQRLLRGAPPFGWNPLLRPGVPAPPWQAPNPGALVTEVNGAVLDLLAPIVRNNPPSAQASQTVTTDLPPPETSAGQQMGGVGSQAHTSPLVVTYLSASSDPFLSLVLGFGTAYQATHSAQNDYMVTARWEAGIDNRSGPFELAAVIVAPEEPGPPPQPANLRTDAVGMLRPLTVDSAWRATTRISWDRIASTPLAGAVSVAAARAATSPAAPTVPLMATRPSGGLRPVAINTPTTGDPPDPEPNRVRVVDLEMEIPTNPGQTQITYGIAVQDIWGMWSFWSPIATTISEPALEPVRIVKLNLSTTAVAVGSACPATLEVEFLLDWRIRTPDQVTFVGKLYPAADSSAPSLISALPAGLDRSLTAGGPSLVVSFSGDVPSAPAATIEPLTEGGEAFAAGFGPIQGESSRRYRLTLSGLTLDFAAAPFVGVALWSRVRERIAPQRLANFQERPAVAAAADPRPPVVTIKHVKLASLPDAGGSCHALISWNPPDPTAPAALGYYIYEADEATLLDAYGKPQPEPDATLDDRLKVLNDAFRDKPLRRPFTRMNATPLTGTSTSLDVVLPRGATGVHCYVVLGISASLVEASWPAPGAADTALLAVGVPRIASPAAPVIEVDRVLDTSTTPPSLKARVSVTTRPGHRPKKIDIHRVRVDDAARALDTMGPPIARLEGGGGGWTATLVPDAKFGSFISSVLGTDAPGGSWRRVWYRAVAWSERDETRGLLPGRSPPSDAAWVVLPPPAPPSLSAPLPGGTATEISLVWTSGAPVARTPLGPHVLTVRAAVVGAPAGTPALISVDSTLNALATAPPATGSGVWNAGTASGNTTYRAILRRASASDVVRILIRLTDPLGRVGEQVLSIGAGLVHPEPNLGDPTIERVAGQPPGAVLRFTSTSPILATGDGPYRVEVTALPRVPRIQAPPPSIELPLPSVPTRALPSSPQPLSILRTGAGPDLSYVVTAQGDVGSFVVRITGPDGRFVEKAAR